MKRFGGAYIEVRFYDRGAMGTKSKMTKAFLDDKRNYTVENCYINRIGLAYYSAKAMLKEPNDKPFPGLRRRRPQVKAKFNDSKTMFTFRHGRFQIKQGSKAIFHEPGFSSRIGEYAEGINYYLAFEYLNASAVYDFNDYIGIIGEARERGSRPDFVIKGIDGLETILESKGTSDNYCVSQINDGIDQINSGIERIWTCYKGYSSAVSFSKEENPNENTIVYMVDPQAEMKDRGEYDDRASRLYECHKHLLVAGKEEDAETFRRLSEGEYEEVNFDNYRETGTVRVEDERGDWYSLKMGFTQELIDYLKNLNSEPRKFEQRIVDNIFYFGDGTYIKIDKLDIMNRNGVSIVCVDLK